MIIKLLFFFLSFQSLVCSDDHTSLSMEASYLVPEGSIGSITNPTFTKTTIDMVVKAPKRVEKVVQQVQGVRRETVNDNLEDQLKQYETQFSCKTFEKVAACSCIIVVLSLGCYITLQIVI